jgi:hypothetical protein
MKFEMRGNLSNEVRRSKSEVRKKSEDLNPNGAAGHQTQKVKRCEIRPSDFGLLSDFGLRTSGFGGYL